MTELLRRASFAVALQMAALPPALAANWDDADATRLLGDPSFLPVAGQVEGNFSYSYQNYRYDEQFNNEAQYASAYKRNDNIFLPTLRFGITDDITVFADFGWANTRLQQSYTYERIVTALPDRLVPTKVQINYRSIGADDPEFGLTWRAIDQRNAPFSLDLTGGYSPDLFRHLGAETRQTGTVAAGGQSGSIQAAISREMNLLTLRAYATFGYDGRRNEIIDDGFADLRSAPHAVYSVGLQSQARLLPWLAINAGVTAQQAMQFDRTSIEGGYVFPPDTIEPSGSISPYVGLTVPLLDQHLVGELQYEHDFINNEGDDFGPDDTQHYYHQQSNVYTARVLFAFGGAAAPMPPPPPAPTTSGGPSVPSARTYLVFFDWDRAELSARARQIVAEAAAASAHTQTTQIEVDGYTDLSGTPAYNQRLSVRRAQSVQAELVRDGVPQSEIGIHGFGESNPLVQTARGVREPQNRRVEILLK